MEEDIEEEDGVEEYMEEVEGGLLALSPGTACNGFYMFWGSSLVPS